MFIRSFKHVFKCKYIDLLVLVYIIAVKLKPVLRTRRYFQLDRNAFWDFDNTYFVSYQPKNYLR